MTPEVITCHDGDSIAKAAEAMAANGVRRLVVLNLGQEITGVLSVDDLAYGLVGEHETGLAAARAARERPRNFPSARPSIKPG